MERPLWSLAWANSCGMLNIKKIEISRDYVYGSAYVRRSWRVSACSTTTTDDVECKKPRVATFPGSSITALTLMQVYDQPKHDQCVSVQMAAL